MKMAKASPEDLDMALDLISVLDDIERGFFPYQFSDPDSEISEWLDFTNREQYGRLIDNLRRLLNRGSIGRVIMGMAVVCDPANECIDPDADTIEHHPMRQQLEAAALWSLWHHQGASSGVGQPIRKLLGMGQHERLTDAQLAQAKAFGYPPVQKVTAVPALVSYPAGSLGEEVAR
jgi:hypothetical protein